MLLSGFVYSFFDKNYSNWFDMLLGRCKFQGQNMTHFWTLILWAWWIYQAIMNVLGSELGPNFNFLVQKKLWRHHESSHMSSRSWSFFQLLMGRFKMRETWSGHEKWSSLKHIKNLPIETDFPPRKMRFSIWADE